MKKLHAAGQVAKLMTNEILTTKGAGKYLIIAMILNIPVLGFIPYLTQAFTIILLAFFLKNTIWNEEKKQHAIEQGDVKYSIPFGKVLIIVTMAFQVVWIPYVMQLVTLVLLGIIYATMTKYEK